jgi:hypothetical protein
MPLAPTPHAQDKPAWFSAPDSAALKILINSLQILAILAGISISLPLPALEFMTWAGILSGGVQASVCAISSPCAMLHSWLLMIAYRARMLHCCRCLPDVAGLRLGRLCIQANLRGGCGCGMHACLGYLGFQTLLGRSACRCCPCILLMNDSQSTVARVLSACRRPSTSPRLSS